MTIRLEVIKSEPGLFIGALTAPYRHIDGDLVLDVSWSDDDACYVARYRDTEVTSCIGTGDSVQDALAHLCGALRCELLAWKDEARGR